MLSEKRGGKGCKGCAGGREGYINWKKRAQASSSKVEGRFNLADSLLKRKQGSKRETSPCQFVCVCVCGGGIRNEHLKKKRVVGEKERERDTKRPDLNLQKQKGGFEVGNIRFEKEIPSFKYKPKCKTSWTNKSPFSYRGGGREG